MAGLANNSNINTVKLIPIYKSSLEPKNKEKIGKINKIVNNSLTCTVPTHNPL